MEKNEIHGQRVDYHVLVIYKRLYRGLMVIGILSWKLFWPTIRKNILVCNRKKNSKFGISSPTGKVRKTLYSKYYIIYPWADDKNKYKKSRVI